MYRSMQHSVLLVLLFLACTTFCSKCPFDSSCDCIVNASTNLTSALCSNRGLDALPNFCKTASLLESFDACNNKIKQIPNYIFSNANNLLYMNLSENNISVLFAKSFHGLEKLVTLNLERNGLMYTLNTIPPTCFRNLYHLKSLNLKNNIGFYPTAQRYPNLSALLELETLEIDGLPKDSFEQRFDTLRELKVLDLSSKDCYIKIIRSDFFLSTPNLQYIDISHCKVQKIWKNTFSGLKNLTYLDVSDNKDLKFAGVENVTYDLQFTAIKVLKFNKVHETFEMNTEIGRNTWKCLQYTNITEMHLDSNRIQLIKTGVLSKLPKTLDILSAADNMFSFGVYILEAKNLNITFINVSFQFSSHQPELGSLNIPSYSINRLKRNLRVDFPLPFPKNLRIAHFRRSQLQYDIPRVEIMENNLQYLDVSSNLLARWKGPTVNFHYLKHLNLSSNYCSNISTFFFEGMVNLEKLYVQNNLLGFSIPFDVDGQILKPLKILQAIDFSQNRIPLLPPLFFIFLERLEALNLHDNLFEDIDFRLTQMKNLSLIDLSRNRIQFLGPVATSQLESVARDHMLSLNLSENPLICSCASLKFLKWMTETKVVLLNRENYICKYENGTKTLLLNVNNIYNKLKKDCSSYPGIIIGITGAIFVSVSIVCFGLFYRYRWKLRYIYYMTKNRFRGYVPVIDHANKTYLYDAFISYAEQDCGFVHNDVIKNLEGEGNLKLCLHKRDFLPGNEIAANITSAIHNSRKTVVILSPHYIDSNWCRFEFNMAKMESMYTRENENILFMVFLTHIPPRELPLMMMEFIDSNSYIEYPDDEFGNVVFWQKMLEAVGG
ncbi:toll-like receptor 4 [Mytilus californianus]|uniref:toll-like receptor 4 n=1 Tax=Mytilus californianus TaxID=6549 RepID=UPI002248378A|nr:toll-like receptor 4 [Mytilus californianus]